MGEGVGSQIYQELYFTVEQKYLNQHFPYLT